jgi:iron complex transport system permease protein
MVFSFSREATTRTGSALLLTGVAISALFISGVGYMSYIDRDPQARSITFWSLGTLSGANWSSLFLTAAVFIVCFILLLPQSKSLNALMLGEQEAQYLGINVHSLRWRVMILNTIMVATVTAFVGVISFIGLVVPHLLRMVFGADHGRLLRLSVPAGAILLTLSDLVARLMLSPAELPIGIVTSVLGVPVFIYLIRTNKYLY